jgi:molecular chaperone DnaK (HSP70)
MKQTVLRTTRTPAPPKILHATIDLGTTFTAAAYAIDHRNGRAFDTTNIRIVSKYPSGDEWEKREVSEVPTELLYKHGEKRAQAWGWEARSLVKNSKDSCTLRSTYATRFKLLLSQKDNSKHVREDLEKRILSGGRSPTDLIVDFLTPLRKHILGFIQNAEDDEEEFAKWIHRWTFTVPADWGPLARRQMLKAAEEAGFDGVVKLISEPEAAALYILEKRVEDRKKLTVRCLANVHVWLVF